MGKKGKLINDELLIIYLYFCKTYWMNTLNIYYIICIKYSVSAFVNCDFVVLFCTSTACLSVLGEGFVLCGSS